MLVLEIIQNDNLLNAAMEPPKDPEGSDCLIPDLIL
jgi:hypothetical protein